MGPVMTKLKVHEVTSRQKPSEIGSAGFDGYVAARRGEEVKDSTKILAASLSDRARARGRGARAAARAPDARSHVNPRGLAMLSLAERVLRAPSPRH